MNIRVYGEPIIRKNHIRSHFYICAGRKSEKLLWTGVSRQWHRLLPSADYRTMLLFKYTVTCFFFFFLLIYYLDFLTFEFNLFVCRACTWRSEDSLSQSALSFHRIEVRLHGEPVPCCVVPFSIALPGQSTIRPESVSHSSDWIWALDKLKHMSPVYMSPYTLTAKLYST